jgi:hypothetical protein
MYNLKNHDVDEQVTEEIPCKRGVTTTKNPFSERKGNIYYNNYLYSMTQLCSEENLKYMVEALNTAYQNGFSEGATMMLNK